MNEDQLYGEIQKAIWSGILSQDEVKRAREMLGLLGQPPSAEADKHLPEDLF